MRMRGIPTTPAARPTQWVERLRTLLASTTWLGTYGSGVQDYYGDYSNSRVTDPTGPGSGSLRVFRGGDWSRVAQFCRPAFRLFAGAGARFSILGFRLVRTQ